MKYRFLGKSGLLVSRVSLGTMTFGTDNWGCGEQEARDIMKEPAAGTRYSFRTQIDGPRFWNEQGFRIAEILEQVSKECGILMAKLAISWPLGRKFVSSVIIGVKSLRQLKENLEAADWDMPSETWKILEERTRPPDEYLGWFSRKNYERFFNAAEFHDERAELPCN